MSIVTLPAKLRAPISGQQPVGAGDQRGVRGLDTGEMGGREPPGQAARGRRRDRRHRRQLDRGGVVSLTVQCHQRVSTQQLRLGQTHQQLTSGGTAGTLLDRPDPPVESAHDVELLDELSEGRDPRHRGQRRVRRADPDTLPGTLPGRLATTYSLHRQGALSAWIINCLDNGDSPSRQGTLVVSHAAQPPATCGSGSDRVKRFIGAGERHVGSLPSPKRHWAAGVSDPGRPHWTGAGCGPPTRRAGPQQEPLCRCRESRAAHTPDQPSPATSRSWRMATRGSSPAMCTYSMGCVASAGGSDQSSVTSSSRSLCLGPSEVPRQGPEQGPRRACTRR